MFQIIQLKHLTFISVTLGLGLGGFIAYLDYEKRRSIRMLPFYLKAMKVIESDKRIQILFGEPYKICGINIWSSKNYILSQKAKIFVPVFGTNLKGSLLLDAIKIEGKKDLVLNKLFFIISDSNEKVILYERCEKMGDNKQNETLITKMMNQSRNEVVRTDDSLQINSNNLRSTRRLVDENLSDTIPKTLDISDYHSVSSLNQPLSSLEPTKSSSKQNNERNQLKLSLDSSDNSSEEMINLDFSKLQKHFALLSSSNPVVSSSLEECESETVSSLEKFNDHKYIVESNHVKLAQSTTLKKCPVCSDQSKFLKKSRYEDIKYPHFKSNHNFTNNWCNKCPHCQKILKNYKATMIGNLSYWRLDDWRRIQKRKKFKNLEKKMIISVSILSIFIFLIISYFGTAMLMSVIMLPKLEMTKND